MNVIESVLAHYGTKGMKWGVRKSRVPKQGPSSDARTAHKAFVKATVSGPQALSNKELSALNNRLNLEQNYQRLSYNPSKLKKGFDQVGQLLKAGKTVDQALEFSKTATGKKIAASLGSKASKKAT